MDPCRACQGELDDATSIKLWDGRWYCPDCVRNTSPELYEYVRKHPVLEESPPFCRRDVWGWAWHVEGFFLVPVVFLLPLSFVYPGVRAPFALFVVGVMGQALIQLPLFVHRTLRDFPVIRLENSTLQVERRRLFFGSVRRVTWSEVRWRLGHSREDSELGGASLIPKLPVILLLLRPGAWTRRGQEPVACGWTEQSFSLWLAFLQLAGVPAEYPRN